MNRLFYLMCALALAGCPQKMTPIEEEEDAGEEPLDVFDGPTSASGIPEPPPYDAGDWRIDSGVITVDTTCCATQFSISDTEPPGGVEGKLRIGLGQFSDGVPLTRNSGRWSASACFPVNQSAPYFYEFTFDGGIIDAGSLELDDGGLLGREFEDIQVTQRASDDEPGYAESDGRRFNFFRAVPNCAGLDGSVPGP